MQSQTSYLGNQPMHKTAAPVRGELVSFMGEEMYCIRNYHSMPPFLMSIVSSSDLWMYLSSRGGLTAGRQHYNNVLFPYETDDKLHEAAATTGPATFIRIKENDKVLLWEPFSGPYAALYNISRNLYKNTPGNKVVFEEINHDLQLTFRYCWMNSDELGWIRRAELLNTAPHSRQVEMLDGLLNLLPWGIGRQTQSMMSTLMDAYKCSEALPGHTMALFYLSSVPVDRAEPSEALRTNLAWTCGLEAEAILLSPSSIQPFRTGNPLQPESKVFGQKTAFLVKTTFSLAAGEAKSWYTMADVAKDSSEVLALQNLMAGKENLADFVEETVLQSTRRLQQLVALSDGLQHTGDALNDRRHFANVMFNIMRGGIFENEYSIEPADFLEHLHESNPAVYAKHRSLFENTTEPIGLQELLSRSAEHDDLLRLALEYLPLSFSRRHGDPSRPWNFFDIQVKKPDGSPSLNYQGNWRDIFQNWEALGLSFPAFIPGMITRFLNASTADGYNPYRLTRLGFDWEVPEPDNPWAYIGYWGDHQIIYLLRLMELQEKFFPGSLLRYANRNLYVYARVPYRIKKYNEILQNPQDTIIFETGLNEQLMEKSRTHGNDGKLMHYASGELQRAGFMEKIMVSLLTKLSNFVPGAGIWLNTQRPEWNDANNALVGNGASMVTLYQMRRFVGFLHRMLENSTEDSFVLAREVMDFYQGIAAVFNQHSPLLEGDVTAQQRKSMTDALGMTGEQYREHVYQGFSAQHQSLSRTRLMEFCQLVLQYTDHTIAANRRPDGLYHSYNLLALTGQGIEINHLELMLEGQASVLGSGMLSPEETLQLLQAMFASKLWRPDQQSFTLYPWKDLPGFLQKNNIPLEQLQRSAWLQQQLAAGNGGVVKQDEAGNAHFSADLRNAQMLRESLASLVQKGDKQLTPQETETILDIYEQVFRHRFFTGRSGSFYKYEGLGSIYWHMVSKLLLSVGESLRQFAADSPGHPAMPELQQYYQRIREGIGLHKKPQDYGAFPTDPYSHTPSMMGVQQPGMTGQVKEDVLSRFMELGIRIENGQIALDSSWLTENLFDKNGQCRFSLCNTGFVLESPNPQRIRIEFAGAESQPEELATLTLPAEISSEIFYRKKTISRVVFC